MSSRAAAIEVRPPRELADLGVVEDHAVDQRDGLEQVVARRLDPQVHRVEGDEARPLALRADAALEVGLDVGEEQHVACPGARAQLGIECLEHSEPGVERRARVQVPPVLTRPEEGLAAAHVLDVVRAGATDPQHLAGVLAEVVADGPDDVHLVEEGRCQREMRRGSAEHPLAPPERRRDGVRTRSIRPP